MESKIYFDSSYLENLILEGKWKKAEKYLAVFIPLPQAEKDDEYSAIWYHVWKQQFFEALSRYSIH
jgi:hypothetical protein